MINWIEDMLYGIGERLDEIANELTKNGPLSMVIPFTLMVFAGYITSHIVSLLLN